MSLHRSSHERQQVKYYTFKTKVLSAAVSAALLSPAGGALAQQSSEREIEEVVVTGSLIRRSEGFTSASPMTQISSEDLAAEGTVNMGQVVQNMTFNSGSSAIGSIQGTESEDTAFNLRGLGTRATLTLIGGKRTPTNNVVNLMPTIGIERLDIVSDGAAALYGSDAVAGVVNYVPFTDYQGFRAEYHEEGDTRGDWHDRQLSMLYGTDLADNINFVAAGSFRNTGKLQWIERPDIMRAGLSASSFGNPGQFDVPQRDEDGNLILGDDGEPVTVTRPDPNCSETREDPAQPNANPLGFLTGDQCRYDYGDMQNYFEPSNITQFYTNLNYEVNSDLSFDLDFIFSRQVVQTNASGGVSGGRTGSLPQVRGELPGNPFRAVAGDGRKLFAEPRRDANGDIVSDGFGQPLPLHDNNGQVVLADNRFASMDADPAGGVPFNEDVFFNAWRPMGKSNTQPASNTLDGAAKGDDDVRNSRFSLTADYNVPYIPNWEGTAAYTAMKSINVNRRFRPMSMSAMRQGLNCDVVNETEACYNPFGVVDDRFLTSQAVVNQIGIAPRQRSEDALQTLDVVLNGTIPLGGFELPGGEIGAAIGYQRREESIDFTPPHNIITGDHFIGDQTLPFSRSRSIDSWFAEFLVPVLPELELSAAYRDESYSTGQGEFIQKYGLTYEPTNWLGLRATFGEAFIAPSLSQLSDPQQCGQSNVDDPFGPFSGFTAACSQGNPNLQPETSDTMSVGFDLTPIDGLQLSMTWSEIDFSNRIVGTSTQDILRTDFLNFKNATGFAPPSGADFPQGVGDFPPVDLVEQWANDPRSDQRIIRSSRDILTVQRVLQSDSNASDMRVRSVDVDLDFTRPFRDFGTFSLNLSGTYIDEWLYDLGPLDPVRFAQGKQNDTFGAVPATPRWRANSRFTWTRGPHVVSTTARYVSSMEYDANNFAFQAAFPHSNYRDVDTIRAWTQQDIFYRYQDLPVPGIGGQVSLTVGLRNMWDREAQKVGMTGGTIGELQSPMGRVAYGRLAYEF